MREIDSIAVQMNVTVNLLHFILLSLSAVIIKKAGLNNLERYKPTEGNSQTFHVFVN